MCDDLHDDDLCLEFSNNSIDFGNETDTITYSLYPPNKKPKKSLNLCFPEKLDQTTSQFIYLGYNHTDTTTPDTNTTDIQLIFKECGSDGPVSEIWKIANDTVTTVTLKSPRKNINIDGQFCGECFSVKSDYRIKKDIEKIKDVSKLLENLNGYTYKLKSNDELSAGFIAQEVEKILPFSVATSSDGIKSVNYNTIIPYLLEGFKEQNHLIKKHRFCIKIMCINLFISNLIIAYGFIY